MVEKRKKQNSYFDGEDEQIVVQEVLAGY